MSFLADLDPEIAAALAGEDRRQRESIVLIASENYASKAVLASGSSVISNKYAEGYPGRRYYGGCENADIVESLAIERARNSSARNTPMYSLTVAPKPTWRCISPCWIPVTP